MSDPQSFTAILSPSVPKLVQSLCQKVHEFEVTYGETNSIDISKTFSRESVDPFRFHIPKTDGSDPVDAIDEECELIENACFLAKEAIRFCTAHMIATLRTRRNQYNTTYRLPNEVLSLIFQFTERSLNPLRPLWKRAPLNVAAVSRLWREVALNTPSLWTRIDAMKPWLAQVFLKRSKEAPLRVEIDADKLDKLPSWAFIEAGWYAQGSNEERDEGAEEEGGDSSVHEEDSDEEGDTTPARSRFSQFINLLKPTAHRWASLELQSASAAEIMQTLCFHLPRLESLRAARNNGLVYDFDTVTVLGTNAPRLRDLHFVAVPMSLASPMYAGLTSLCLENVYHDIGTIPQLFSVLGACPDLERLILINYHLHGLRSAENSPPILIMLSRLQHLQFDRVDGHLPKVVLNSISAPSSLTLDLGMEVSSWAEAVMPTNLPNASLIRHMFVTTCPAERDVPVYTITGKASEDGPVILEIRYTPTPISFLLHAGAHTPDILRHLGQGNVFSSLEALTFSEHGFKRQVSASSFAEMLGNFPSLKELALRWCPSDLLDALIVSPHLGLQCPQLHTLRLYDVSFDETLLKLVDSRAHSRDRGHLESLELLEYFDKYPCASIIAALKGLVAVSEDPVPRAERASTSRRTWRSDLA
ncbi:hypothetical protein BOTBODRAFT_611939 [Botryobasidium botryosum FD-172 SS1]|uniref:F-box domain-containing protein n=1 Tax=Botryobasidium botryosum (strain FD-172 SS1) TaxID=930990 RepID=A0A067LVD0_BOTB1|nr:hypothetical protein BOTBODRAFT_611939 [Botryobasidium botryosum FD-172 SS1]